MITNSIYFLKLMELKKKNHHTKNIREKMVKN